MARRRRASPAERSPPTTAGDRRAGGIIPTGAGSTGGPQAWVADPAGHPRGRGEHRWATGEWTAEAGPSRRRGESTTAPTTTSSWHGDLPRGREEHGVVVGPAHPAVGPSPRARGAQVGGAVARVPVGTIPAGVGSTRGNRAPRSCAGGHPRGRGEHSCFSRATASPPGPSPRARGAPVFALLVLDDAGTIPAGAGSTPVQPLRHSHSRDHPRGRGEHRPAPPYPARPHPRGRGEHSANVVVAALSVGPSPRARGAPSWSISDHWWCGTIPAGAGSTSWSGRESTCARDHPRGRGEHSSSASGAGSWAGPSPRARGAPRIPTAVHQPVGTIPAGAGSTARGCPSTRT